MKIKRIISVAHHRNGVSGTPFDVVIFRDIGPQRSVKVGIVFDAPSYCAVLDIAKLADNDIKFGSNSWRGDDYEPTLRRAIAERLIPVESAISGTDEDTGTASLFSGMAMSQHRIPWTVSKRDANGTGNVAIKQGDLTIAFTICKDWGYEATATRAEARATANLIVYRVNVHERLVAALRALVPLAEWEAESLEELRRNDEVFGEGADKAWAAIKEAQALIAEVEPNRSTIADENTESPPRFRKPIVIEVRGGMVQDVQNVPPGVKYEIVDYDNQEEQLVAKDRAESTLPPDPEGMNDARAIWAAQAISAFRKATGTDDEDALPDLLADLMHLADRKNYDFSAAMARALYHYHAETLRDETVHCPSAT